MAGSDGDNNTDDWRLLWDEYCFIAGLTYSEKLADELLRVYLEEGRVDRDGRARYRICVKSEALPGPTPSPYDGSFWRSDPERGIQCEMIYRDSSACWTGPASAEAKAAFGRQTAEYRVRGVQLCHGAVVDFLRGAGLLPPVQQPTETAAETAAESTQPQPEPEPESKAPLTDKESLKRWLPGAVERWPRDEVNTDDYAEFLRGKAPKKWTKHYIQTELSALAKEKRSKKS